MLFGVGLMAYSVEKTGEVVNDMIKKGDETLEKNQKMFKETFDKMKKIEGDIEKKVGEQVVKTLETMNIPTKKDIEELNKKLDLIAKKFKE